MLTPDKLSSALDVLNNKEVPPLADYFVLGGYLYRMLDDGTQFSDDDGETWHAWDSKHPACELWTSVMSAGYSI